MNWRLGLDLGTNSLGWWAYKIEKKNLRWEVTKSLGGGVYIFPDGREPAKGGRVGDSNAVQRRLARSMRRNRDRRKTRLRACMQKLVDLGLMPVSREERDDLFQTPPKSKGSDKFNPYFLRAEAAQRKLEPYELGRALYHLALRRGFKSNRVVQNSDEDGGKLKERIDELRDTLAGKTLGQFLWARHEKEVQLQKSQQEKPSGIRFRGQTEFYPERSMYEDEFDKIQEIQSPHYKLSDEDWKELKEYVLFQHPLKPVERGSCEFFPDEKRHWSDTPIGHDFRIYQEVGNLKWIDSDQREHSLTVTQRDGVIDLLLTRKSDVKFDSLRKAKGSDGALLFPDCVRFNLESEKRKALKNHSIGARLLGKSKAVNKELAELWHNRCSEDGDDGYLDDIFEELLKENDEEKLKKTLAERHGLENNVIKSLASLSLRRATASVSRRFMEEIVPIMRDQGLPYVDAVQEMGLHHSRHHVKPDRTKLPYYGEIVDGLLGADSSFDPELNPENHFGKINNPTVHVALNSLRRVVNTLIERFDGCPTEIHVELARELKQPRKIRDEITRQQSKNQKRNEEICDELRKHGIANPSVLDVKKVKLWEELGPDKLSRRCPFSGKNISFSQLMNGDAEIEHILPFKRTLDNSMNNLTVAMRWANRLKGNKTPHEAFANDEYATEGINWEVVRDRAESLPASKAWRFGPDAMKRFEGENDFIARQLTDNAYIARTASNYLKCLKGVEQIVPNRGGLTALLRGKWRLNETLSRDFTKNREDHRHHAVDAAVIGLANRSALEDVSRQTARDNSTYRERIEVPEMPSNVYSAICSQIQEITVAYKPDHGWQGSMFKQTAYGFIKSKGTDPDHPDYKLVTRKPITDLTDKECLHIRDRHIREAVTSLLPPQKNEKEKKQALKEYSDRTGTKKVRILVADQTVQAIPSAPYKGYSPDSYVCCDVWRCLKGKRGAWKRREYEWIGVFWSYKDTPQGVPAPEQRKLHPTAKFVCRLYKNDLVAHDENGFPKIMRVAGFSTTNNKLDLAPHTAANPGCNHVSINVVGRKGLRKLYVSPDGKVRGL